MQAGCIIQRGFDADVARFCTKLGVTAAKQRRVVLAIEVNVHRLLRYPLQVTVNQNTGLVDRGQRRRGVGLAK